MQKCMSDSVVKYWGNALGITNLDIFQVLVCELIRSNCNWSEEDGYTFWETNSKNKCGGISFIDAIWCSIF
jgi:hypothetical protein